ncbi:MAG: rRNA pseudouridine synthase [Verrucomicrobia bacterium]|nr:rRNA pseudouridine synthase [Verrucomicrobiota bacterium]
MKPAPRHLSSYASKRTGLARALSKLGFCSRSQAWEMIKAGRVRLNGLVQRDPEKPVLLQRDRIEVDGQPVRAEEKVYLALNKPRGLVTTARDEKGRATVFECLAQYLGGTSSASPSLIPSGEKSGTRGARPSDTLPRVFPVGRLDQASEGLLLFTNDTAWADRLTDPATQLEKIYHVQVNCLADESLALRMTTGVTDAGELLAAKRVSVLRHGGKNSWLEVVLDEGKNRHLRRLLESLHVEVLRLVRVAIGPLELDELAKGQVRPLTPGEVQKLSAKASHGR